MGKQNTQPFQAVFEQREPCLSADEAALIYGLSAKALAKAILENRDGKYDRLYQTAAEGSVIA